MDMQHRSEASGKRTTGQSSRCGAQHPLALRALVAAALLSASAQAQTEAGATAASTAAEPIATEPAAAAPEATELAPAEPASAQPAAAEPPPVEPVAAEPPPVEPAAAEVGATSSTSPEGASGSFVPPSRPPSPFDRGRLRIGGMIGWAQASTYTGSINWFILGVGVGYNVLDGLEPHVDTTFWIGDPFVTTLTPGLRYVFHMVPVVKPYVGGFYRHYFVSGNDYGWDDSDALGGRAGVYFMTGPMSYFGGGIIYEHFLDENLFSEVDQVYPEITIAIAF
jgi:hypothetical protein